MASIDTIKVAPARNTVNPEIKIKVWLKLFGDDELPVNFSGSLVDLEDIRIAPMSQWEIGNNTRRQLAINNNRSERNIVLTFYFQFTKKALEYIEELREQDSNKDVNLKLNLNVGSINSKFRNPNIEVEKANKGLNYLHEQNVSNKSSKAINLLATQRNGEIMEVGYREVGERITISSSDWAQNYCPALGVGKFATVDLYMPDLVEAESEWEKYLNDAIQTVQKMENYVQAGEWTNVIEESRKLAEVLREKEHWGELLSHSGYQDDALDQFHQMLQNLFQFSSKFVHRIDFDKNLRDQVKIEKEDAYFIYTTSIGLVNLLSRKVQEFKKSK